MSHATTAIEAIDLADLRIEPPDAGTRRRSAPVRLGRCLASAIEWAFGFASLVVGLSSLAALPVAQFLVFGYMLESSARVARTGRLRDGVIGVRRSARVGGLALGFWLASLPLWLIGRLARSAELIDPGGPIARHWRSALVVSALLMGAHVALACLRGGLLRHFLWPFGHPGWLARRLQGGGFYAEARDGLWAFVASFRLPYYFRLGLVGFLGTFAWIAVPALLIASGGWIPPAGFVGVLALAIVAPSLPFLQVRYALEGRAAAFLEPRAIRDRYRRAPWAFAFALLVTIAAAIPLYLLKIEMIPREALWLPGLLFVAFLAPTRILTGWAYARSGRREQPRHWLFRVVGRLAIVPAALLYVLVVFLAQYISWGGTWSLFEQHALLLPVPFLNI